MRNAEQLGYTPKQFMQIHVMPELHKIAFQGYPGGTTTMIDQPKKVTLTIRVEIRTGNGEYSETTIATSEQKYTLNPAYIQKAQKSAEDIAVLQVREVLTHFTAFLESKSATESEDPESEE
jgi:hypothetical protein